VDVPGQGNVVGTRGWTPLLFAARGGHLEIVQLLLDHSANVNIQSKEEPLEHWTALHIAIGRGHPQVVKVLLECGADPHFRTKEGETPFQLAKSAFWLGSEAN